MGHASSLATDLASEHRDTQVCAGSIPPRTSGAKLSLLRIMRWQLDFDMEAAMTTLQWTDTLVLDFPPMDDMHHEFVDLLAQVETCTDADLTKLWEMLIERTCILFGQEDNWMLTTQFSSATDHTLQHRVVLNVMREGLAQARAGQTDSVRGMAAELGRWFAKHIQSLDAALALHMRRQDMDSGGSTIH